MLLKVDNISVTYGHAKALHEVSLKLNSGEVVFIVGRNGAGKTTLLKTIAGFMKPTEGSILFNDYSLVDFSIEKTASEGIRYIFQDKRVFTKLTVKENIALSAYASRIKLSEAVDKIVTFYPKINKMMSLKAGNLSGGQRQILLFGCAVISNPKILLIDEPTEGLAAVIIDEIINLIEKIKGKVSMVIVEQNISIVCRLADRIYVMKEGKISKEIIPNNNIENRLQIRKDIEDYV